MKENAVLMCGDKKVSLPMLSGTDGIQLIDITTLYRDHKVLTYDPGFMSTAACSSEITFIDGEKGILRHRGLDIADLIGIKGGFCSVAHLLLYGVLPSDTVFEQFLAAIGAQHALSSDVLGVISSFRRDAHPMAILMACFSTLAAKYHGDNRGNEELAVLAIAQVPSLVAAIYLHRMGLELVSPDPSLSYTGNFVKMMFGALEKTRADAIEEALDAIFIMHADHEQNASTATVRMAGSAGTELFACLAAGTATLWGPAHGGANEAVIRMLESIGSPDKVEEFIGFVKDNNSKVRLMGFGHRVYKSYDPRAKILGQISRSVLDNLGCSDELLGVAEELERCALQDEYFVERKLYPNVDFYSGIVLRAMGVPVEMYTTFFALARTAGWVSQWCELLRGSESLKICRPRQLYAGK
uniref:Citrate synthase n=1 Tax=Anaplasma platys TaxID=949 RepID=Q8KQN0_9RICK|nr:citrate synthase [Anaplasma platys]AGH33735.1 citrate synthase [Anaplasma platys]WCJ12476.1 citrate synthase [Anaplasma platys]WCJ12477.1 citrate synthase [Anaplasma platys]